MFPHRRRRSFIVTVLTVAVGLAACDNPPETPFEPEFGIHSDNARPFEVYTQNLFHGGDTEPIITLDFNNIPAVVQAANVFWNDVQNSDFPLRVVEIVDEIEQQMPHVVAFQEVFQIAVLNAQFQPIGGLDMLAEVEAEIKKRNLPYTTDVIQDNTNVPLPLGLDLTIGAITQWLNVTDRIASLRRTDVELLAVDNGTYETRMPLGPVTLTRGWARQAVEHAGSTVHFVNTHLETQALAPIQVGQADELLNDVVVGLDGVTIIAGDLNSDAAGEPGDPKWTPTYGNLVDGGFIDLWVVAPPANRDDVGLTCCHDKSLTGDSPFDQRLDFLLVRTSGSANDDWGEQRGQFKIDMVGEEAGDRTVGGLWPSDHAGLKGSMKIPLGLLR